LEEGQRRRRTVDSEGFVALVGETTLVSVFFGVGDRRVRCGMKSVSK